MSRLLAGRAGMGLLLLALPALALAGRSGLAAASIPAGVPAASCPLTAEQMASLAHPASAFSGLTAVRSELLHNDAGDRPAFEFPPEIQPVDYCAGYEVFWQVHVGSGLPNPDADSNREHSDLILAFPTAADASAVFQRLAATVTDAAAAQVDPERGLVLLNPPVVGDESLAGITTEYDQTTDAGGVQQYVANVVQSDIGFRRGSALVLSSDRFSPDGADYGISLALAQALDGRIVAALP